VDSTRPPQLVQAARSRSPAAAWPSAQRCSWHWAALSSFVGLTEVLFAITFAWFALGWVPTLTQAMGGVLIIAGIALVRAGMLRPEVDGTESTSDDSAEPALAGTPC
jgi:hypothetical protein